MEKKMTYREITQRESLRFRGMPFPPPIVKEYAWVVADGEHLSAVLFLDLTDQDYGFAILGKDDDGHHRWIDGDHSFPSEDENFEKMVSMLAKYLDSGQTLFSQKNPDW
jgi:hypothetical protein